MTETEDNAASKNGIQVDIDANFESGVVFAVLAPADFQEALTVAVIHEKLELIGVNNWDIQNSAIEDVLLKVKKGQLGRIILGAKKDASVQITINSDEMQAYARVSPAKGGKPLSREMLISAIKDKEIDEKRILDLGIKQAISAKTEVQIEVARGKFPVRGKDTEFVHLVSNQEHQNLEPDEHGKIDFLAGRVYLNVSQGTPILQRIPAEPGKIGLNIFGHLIQPENGTDIAFEMPLEGASISPDDPNVIVADIDGHPIFSPHGVKVDPTLHFNNISLATGHVEFKGSVEVKGDVMPGMKVIASGDIFIKGTVERAYVEAGANIVITGGAVGDIENELDHSSTDAMEKMTAEAEGKTQEAEEDELPVTYECEIKAAGNISLKYATVTKLSAANIEVKEYIFNSLTEAACDISIGQSGGKGKLVGGKAIAGHAIIAKVLGSQAYNKTKLLVGTDGKDRLLHKKLLFLRQKRQEQAYNLKQLQNKISKEKIKIADSDEAKKSRKIDLALVELSDVLADINHRIAYLEERNDFDSVGFIQSTSACFPNVSMEISGAHLVTQQESKAATFIRNGHQVVKKL